MFDQQEIWRVAMAQSARDLNCRPEDFLSPEPVIVPGGLGPQAKRYYEPPVPCLFVSYGRSVVVSAREDCLDVAREYVSRDKFYHCFDTPQINWLNERLSPLGLQVCFQAEYFLPVPDRLRPLDCPYEMRVLTPENFSSLYLPQWSNALCEKRRALDMLGVGAYDGDTLVGLAGCSADAEDMWQIGIDVLPACRRRGIAAALCSRLALEIFARGKVPFYCAAWSNLPSVRNALKCGFSPAWVEMSVKPVIDSEA